MTCIVDWSDVCLVCLQKGKNRCVFDNEEDTELSIADKIMKCSDISIKKGKNQPDNICVQCLEDLNVSFKFRQNCEQSNSIIKAILSKDNRELEVSGLRIKIPANLKVKQTLPESTESTLDETPLIGDSIKHEDDDCTTSNDCENFDSTDFLETAEVLDDDGNDDDEEEEEEVGPFGNAFKDIEKLELIPELEQIKTPRKNTSKTKTQSDPPKRGRGRPKKVINREPDPEYTPTDEPGTTYQRAFIQRIKNPDAPKPPKICEICGNSYKYQHALNSHMRRHRNERPFNCEFCDKAFVSAVELRRHMRVHTGQKPYECQYCERRFSDFGSRIKHERTHTGERPYVCISCGKNFAYAHVLTVHMRTHTGEKKFPCSKCGRGFTKKAYLDNHMIYHNTDAISGDPFETSEAAATITREYDDKMEIGLYVMSTNGRVKPKEEQCDDVIIQDDFHSISHVGVP